MNIAKPEERIARFFAKLDAMLDITARQLHERMEFQKTAFAKQFPAAVLAQRDGPSFAGALAFSAVDLAMRFPVPRARV